MSGRTETREQLYFQVQDFAASMAKDNIRFNAMNSISLVMGLRLGRERMISLLDHVAGSGSVARSIDYYVNALKPEDISAFYVAMGYMVGSALVPNLVHAYLDPWSTKDFFNDVNSRLDATPIPTLRLENLFSEKANIEEETAKLDLKIGTEIRAGIEIGHKVDYFFEDMDIFRRLAVAELVYGYGGDNLVITTYNAGGDFLDVLSRFPTKQSKAINFLEGLED